MTAELTRNQEARAAPVGTPAATYEQWFVPAMFDPLATAFLDHVQPQPSARVLDVACGTGIVARRVASIVGPRGHVVGLDLSPGMLAVARSAAEREGVTIEWQEGRVDSLPFPDSGFDLVLCQQGLQFVPDKPAAVAEMRRVLTRGGCVALSVWQGLDQHPFCAAVHAVLLRQLHAPVMQAPFSLDDSDELRALLSDAEFEDVVIRPVTITANFPEPER